MLSNRDTISWKQLNFGEYGFIYETRYNLYYCYAVWNAKILETSKMWKTKTFYTTLKIIAPECENDGYARIHSESIEIFNSNSIICPFSWDIE